MTTQVYMHEDIKSQNSENKDINNRSLTFFIDSLNCL